jgi:hypothetical protein
MYIDLQAGILLSVFWHVRLKGHRRRSHALKFASTLSQQPGSLLTSASSTLWVSRRLGFSGVGTDLEQNLRLPSRESILCVIEHKSRN